MNKIAVVGAGAWGTALAIQAYRAGCRVDLVARDEAAARAISLTGSSPRLENVRIPDGVVVTDALDDAAQLLVWAVPIQALRASLDQFRPQAAALALCMKGVEAGTGRLPTEIVAQVLGGKPAAVLSGPNFAREIALGLPAASVVAATDPALRRLIRACLGSASFRLYGNSDPVGVQLCGATKNVVAIAAGAVMGAGFGENARAALVTRGLSELRRLIVAEGGLPETVMGLSGIGDLMLSCAGPSSRNFRFGLALGAGASAEVVAERSGTVEGWATARALVERAAALELPICQAVADLAEGTKTLEQVVESLLSRPPRDE